MLRCKCLDAVDGENELEVKWLFGPERAVIIERGYALFRWNKVGCAFFCYAGYKVVDRLR